MLPAVPNIEYVPAWKAESFGPDKVTMPYEIWQQLTPHGQAICAKIAAEPGVEVTGAGLMHPASAERARLSGNGGFWADRVKQQRRQQEEQERQRQGTYQRDEAAAKL